MPCARSAAGGDPEAGAGEVTDDRRAGPAGRGVDGDADRLVDHHDGVVVVDDLDALDDLGHHLERVGLGRDRPPRASCPAPAGRSCRPPRPRRRTRGPRRSGRRRGCARARTCGPSRRRRARPEPLGHHQHPVVDGRHAPPGRARVRPAVPSSRTLRKAWSRISAGADVDADVGHVEDRPVREHEQVDHVPRRGPGSRSSRSVRLPAIPASSRPSATAHRTSPSRRLTHSTTSSAPIATRLNTTVNSVTGAERRARVAHQVQAQPVAEHLDVTVGQALDGPDLGQHVDGVRRQRDEDEDGAAICGGGRGGPMGPASLSVSDAPRAACMSCTVWHGGRPSPSSCRWGCRTTRRCRRCHRPCGASARSIWASFSRSFWTTMISWSRSKLVAPMSAWSWPAPSPASRISLSSSASWPERVRTTRSRSSWSSERTSLISALVQAPSPSLTTRALTALRALLGAEPGRVATGAVSGRGLLGRRLRRGAVFAPTSSWPFAAAVLAGPSSRSTSWPGPLAALLAAAWPSSRVFLAVEPSCRGLLRRPRSFFALAGAVFLAAVFLAGAVFLAAVFFAAGSSSRGLLRRGGLLGRGPSSPGRPSWPRSSSPEPTSSPRSSSPGRPSWPRSS